MSAGDAVTRVTLFVPGVARRTRIDGAEVDWVENDGRFGKAFAFGTVAEDVVARIDAAPGALVAHWTVDLRKGRAQIVAAVEKLRDAGAIAVRLEQSKLGWEVSRWLEMFASDDEWAWHRGAIAFLGSKGTMQSCGMHAFSLPDVRIALDGDQRELQQLASRLDVYQIAEDPVIRSGETFALDRETPRRLVERWPDTEYPSDHACHNPYGVWRLGPAGGVARSLGELDLVFMPALRLVLAALEEKRGQPLTKKHVESARDKGVCMAMKPRDAQRLERDRGYADLDPELVWEQWKLVRSERS